MCGVNLSKKRTVGIDEQPCSYSEGEGGDEAFDDDADLVSDLAGAALTVFFRFVLSIDEIDHQKNDDEREGEFVKGIDFCHRRFGPAEEFRRQRGQERKPHQEEDFVGETCDVIFAAKSGADIARLRHKSFVGQGGEDLFPVILVHTVEWGSPGEKIHLLLDQSRQFPIFDFDAVRLAIAIFINEVDLFVAGNGQFDIGIVGSTLLVLETPLFFEDTRIDQFPVAAVLLFDDDDIEGVSYLHRSQGVEPVGFHRLFDVIEETGKAFIPEIPDINAGEDAVIRIDNELFNQNRSFDMKLLQKTS